MDWIPKIDPTFGYSFGTEALIAIYSKKNVYISSRPNIPQATSRSPTLLGLRIKVFFLDLTIIPRYVIQRALIWQKVCPKLHLPANEL